MHSVYLSLGTNIGHKEQNMLTAISKIREMIGVVRRQSSFIETEPWGFSSENTFLNAAILVETELSPLELLHITQQIELEMGRRQKSHGGEYHDRIIDIDILLYDDIKMSTEELTIPHPLMTERDFVMIPLNEII